MSKTSTSSFVKVSGDSGGGGLVYGYLNSSNGKFYEESTYTTEIPGDSDKLFITLDDDYIYRYDTSNTAFVQIGGSGSATGGEVFGYLNPSDGKFYEESTYITEITPSADKVYIALDTNYIYRYDTTNTEYVLIGGTASSSIQYVNSLPTTGIEDTIYGTVTELSGSATAAANFLDSVSMFEKETTGGGYYYEPGDGLEVKVSLDGTTYKDVTSIAYDNSTANQFTITYTDATTATLAFASTLYYKQVTRNYYAGNSTDQTLTPFNGGSGGGGTTYYPGTGIDITGSIISQIPATTAAIGGIKPDNSTLVVDANGTLSGNYQAGHGIIVDGNEISDKTFVGTQAQWDALTPAQQAEYDMISITDDGAPVTLVSGHSIKDDSGTGYPQRTYLKVTGATVTDDSTNDATVVDFAPYTEGRGIDIDSNNEIAVEDTITTTFTGTVAEWNALSIADKAKYEIVNLTDDPTCGDMIVVDTVADGNMNAVTSNAVYDYVDTMITQALNTGY